MQKLIDSIIARYGTTAILDSGIRMKVLFRSTRSNAWESYRQIRTPAGTVSRARYECLLPASSTVVKGEQIMVYSRKYLLRQVEYIMAGDRVLCKWALCVEGT